MAIPRNMARKRLGMMYMYHPYNSCTMPVRLMRDIAPVFQKILCHTIYNFNDTERQ
jgi:hypothetical protein